MSDTFTYKGEIKEIYTEYKKIYEKVENYCIDNNIEIIDNDYILDMLYEDELIDKVIKVGNNLYEVITKESLDSEDIFEATVDEDGTINYLVQYYNGGCSFDEAIYEAITKRLINKK